jgi:two-component system sensor histidine kinase UhpB
VLADERSRLLAHVFEIQDAERQKIARDLHDEIGQSFTSLLVHLRVLEESPSLDDARRQAHDIRTLSGTLYDQIRTLARGLHPTVLDDLGLVAAVQRLAEDFEATHDTVVAVQLTGNFTSRLPPKLEKAAYRIVQESLTNCAKYAQASHIDIALARDEKQFKVTIADNGQGFDARKIASETTAATFGLANMRERALLLNGSLTIRSRPSAGATVTAQFPLKSP